MAMRCERRRAGALGAVWMLALCVLLPLGAQEGQDNGVDEDSLFGDEGGLVEEEEPEAGEESQQEGESAESTGTQPSADEDAEETSPTDRLLTSEDVDFGGRIRSNYTSTFTWNEGIADFEEITAPDDSTFETNLGTRLFFDARPESTFRVLGKFDVNYPFRFAPAEAGPATIEVFELFSDVSIKDRVFLRIGKQTVHTGTGYFFSPADVLSLVPIDPDEPEEEREGPLAAKVNVPVDIHNLYLYVVAHDVESPEELAVAPEGQLVVGPFELAAGGYYRKDVSPRGYVTAAGTVWDFNVFAELVGSYGSDRTYVEETDDPLEYPLGVRTFTVDEELFMLATAGFRYTDTEVQRGVAGQYFYQGTGYEDPAVLSENRTAVATLLQSGELAAGDLRRPGQHYGAASVFWREIGDTPLSASALWIGNLSDGSGRVVPSVTYEPFERIDFSLSVPVHYGQEGEEFTPSSHFLSLSFTAALGEGSF